MFNRISVMLMCTMTEHEQILYGHTSFLGKSYNYAPEFRCNNRKAALDKQCSWLCEANTNVVLALAYRFQSYFTSTEKNILNT